MDNNLCPQATATTATLATPSPLAERWWFNTLWFQLTWLSAVLGRGALLPLTVALLALHLLLVAAPRRELRCLAWVALPGMAVDSALSLAGVFQFEGGALIPLWLCALWLAFATTLRRSLQFLHRSPWLAALIGTLVPLNYLAGERLGAVTLGYGPWLSLALLVPLWALLLPALCAVTRRCCPPSGEEVDTCHPA
jgi:hypothetical protein